MPNEFEPANPHCAPTSIYQVIQGDRTQAIGQALNSTVINSVETLNQISQHLPRNLEVARYSLPADPVDFVGRDDDIQRITADLQAGWVVAIAGMAGVGKSALAVRIAHRLKATYPGGQIYLNLRGADTHPLTVEAALESLLRGLGLDPAQMPPQLADKVALYRSRMAQTPSLILLDNAANAQQIEPLLPGAGACLITSRPQLDGLAGVRPHNLDALPEHQALALLQTSLPPDRVQADPAAAQHIVHYCGRLPLALRIAAATLGKRSWQGRRLADYAQQLADERQRLNHLTLENLDVRASFALSYRDLPPDAAQLLGWLGLLPSDFGLAILAPLTPEPEETLATALATLVDSRLVDPVAETDERYRLHDLMRLFALETLDHQATPAAILASKARLVDWCADQANTWENALDPTRRRQWAETLAAKAETPTSDWESRLLQTALAWFEAERPTLLYGFTWATDTQQTERLVALAADLASFFQLRGYWGDWVTTHQQALTIAQTAGDQRGESQTLNNLGLVYKAQGKWGEALDCYQQSLAIKRAIGDVQGEGQTLNNLGTVYKDQGKWREAIDCYQQSLAIKRAIGDVQGEGQSIMNMGTVYQAQGKWGEALDCYQQSLETFRAIGDVHGEGQSIMNMGTVYQAQGKWGEAIDCYQQSLETFRTIGDVHGEGQTLNNLGLVYQDQGKWGEAIDCYQQSLAIGRTIGDVHGEGQTLNNLGNVYQAQGKWDEAIDGYQQSLAIKRAIGDVHGEGQTLNNLGLVYQDQGKWGEAIDCYQQSLAIYRVIGDVHGEGLTLANIGVLHQQQGQLEQTITVWQEALMKLHPDAPEFHRLSEMLQAVQQPQHAQALQPSRFNRLMVVVVIVGGLILLIPNLLAGRWGVAVVIVGVYGVAWWGLRVLLRWRS